MEYIYDYFSTNIIYWEALLVRREKVMRNGTKGPSYDFLTIYLQFNVFRRKKQGTKDLKFIAKRTYMECFRALPASVLAFYSRKSN